MPYALCIVYMLGLFALSSVPDNGDGGYIIGFITPTIQNFLHVPVYGFLALLWIFALRGRGFSERQSILLAILLSSTYGLVMEIFQIFIPGRFASVTDFFLNLTGILVFTWLYQRFKVQRTPSLSS